ncbi:MAG TPA: LD-carboxypeptidase [Candidatus Binataceae bacterium]|nr:LD-carboxypeptidase [Candidatus Binataceae bacterium]
MPSAPVKPPALHPGDTVGVVAPAAAIDREYLERGVGALGAMGFRVKVSGRALARSGILAGGDRERAAELQDYFADDSVRAIFAARGGYGCGRLLPMLDFARIARTPKPFIGFSDETFLLNPLVMRAGIVAIHGPMIAMDFARGLSARSFGHLRALLTGELSSFELAARECVHPGVSEGELIGGCLSVIVAMLATPFAPDFRGRILFLEDTGERAYRIDRMLVQLRQSGVLAAVAGIVFGAIRPLEGNADEAKLISRFCAEQTAGLGIPVIAGIEAGHGTENLALPFGVRARLDANAGKLAILEPAVAS